MPAQTMPAIFCQSRDHEPLPEKFCEICHCKLEIRPREKPANFRLRQTCGSPSCVVRSRYKERAFHRPPNVLSETCQICHKSIAPETAAVNYPGLWCIHNRHAVAMDDGTVWVTD